MSKRFNDRTRRAAPGHGQPLSEGHSSGNFKLNLRERDLGGDPQRSTQADRYASRQMQYTEKERRRQEREHRKRNRIKAGKNKRLFTLVWLVMVLLVSFTMASFLIAGSNDFFGINRVDSITDVVIPENVDSKQLAMLLKEHGVINNELFFELYCKLTAENKLQAMEPGTYSIETDRDYENIITILRAGDTDREVVTITFPEGISALEAATLLEENGVCSQKEALDAMNEALYGQYSVVSDLRNESLRYYKLEGYLYPDTYDFYKEDGPAAVYKKMLGNCVSKLDIVQDTIMQSGMTLDEVMTLASIIQREAADVNDMYRVSAVLNNRLKEDPDSPLSKLECDSTFFYPYHRQSDLPPENQSFVSTYNTYDVVGLPIGPICNPGIDAIKAALRPALDAADYFYFCHAADGTAYYARTFEEHEANLVLAGLTDGAAAAEGEAAEGEMPLDDTEYVAYGE